MNGPADVNLFTLFRVRSTSAFLRGDTPWGRLYAALALSCLLHAAVFFLPYFGASAAAVQRAAARGAQELGAVRVLDVRLEPARGPAAAIDGIAETGPAAAPVAGRPRLAAEARPPQQLARGADLLPVPAPAFYTTDQLTRRPELLEQPQLQVPREIARMVRGKVGLKIWIDEFGNVVSVEVESTNLPATVSGLAAEAFGKLRYEPGEIDGRRVPVLLKVEVNYDPRLTRY